MILLQNLKLYDIIMHMKFHANLSILYGDIMFLLFLGVVKLKPHCMSHTLSNVKLLYNLCHNTLYL